ACADKGAPRRTRATSAAHVLRGLTRRVSNQRGASKSIRRTSSPIPSILHDTTTQRRPSRIDEPGTPKLRPPHAPCPSVPTYTMRRALAYTIAALGAAAKVDIDRTKEDRDFFAAEREKIVPLAAQLEKADHALERFDLGPGMEQQACVELGDAVLDRGV